ncbi:DUF2789 domain-containing protein [Azonexus hydrophilus]|uniref:DUF2789 domain-containing protein n=1 Tax=Azonexus hydrophilus TaxID=418702 RepID=UPI002490FB4B|nr:DUF2789 domain-containing protein [Azonexus hydrophilus]
MESAIHRFHDLFAQLGLPNHQDDIGRFIAAHRTLGPDIALPDAPYWTPAQSSFLREALQQDADWAELVDQLNQALRVSQGCA